MDPKNVVEAFCDLMGTRDAEALRPYLADDMIGAEAGGAVKNVLAIACGIVEGRNLGRSAHAAVITRGFAELTRLATSGDARWILRLPAAGPAELAAAATAAANRWRVYAVAGAGPAQSRVAQVAHRGFQLLAQQIRDQAVPS